jgi:nucleotide-binding universal stress UspA family protein
MAQTRVILHPTDFGEHSRAALNVAANVARGRGARLVVLHVVPRLAATLAAEMAAGHTPSEHFEGDMIGYRREMERLLDRVEAPDAGLPFEKRLAEGEVGPTIVKAAEELPCELIVMGSRGKKRVEKALMGSVADYVMRMAPCPVLAVNIPYVPS